MGKNKSCDASTRKIIVNFHFNQNWNYRDITNHWECSMKKAYNAIACFKQHSTTDKVPRKVRSRKTTIREDKLIIRLVKAVSFKGFNEIRKEVSSQGDPRNITARLVRRRLFEAKLFGRVSRKVPLLPSNRKNRISFARKYCNWAVRQWK